MAEDQIDENDEYTSWLVKMKKQKFDNVPVAEVEAVMDFTCKKRNSIHNMTNLKKKCIEIPKSEVYQQIMSPNPFKKKRITDDKE